MADNKSKRGAGNRRQVAGGESYEVNHFARKHGISKDQAEGLIKRIGNDREKLNAAAAKLSLTAKQLGYLAAARGAHMQAGCSRGPGCPRSQTPWQRPADPGWRYHGAQWPVRPLLLEGLGSGPAT